MIYTLSRKEDGISKEKDGITGFRKILAAHSFTWIGAQSMFVYLFAFVRYRVPELSGVEIDPALRLFTGKRGYCCSKQRNNR